MRKRVTIKDLADELSLSPATVSLVLSGKADSYRIAPATKRRVEEAAERLAYRPDRLAQAMRQGRTGTVGVVFPNVSESYMNHVLEGIEEAAVKRKIGLMIATSSFSHRIEARNIRALLDRRVDGLILIPYAPFRNEIYDDGAIREAAAEGIPIVAVDRYNPEVITHAVVGSDYEAARKAASKLLESGCRRLAYLGFDLVIATLEERRRGFFDVLEEAGLADEAKELLVEERNDKSGDIRDWLSGLDEKNEMPDGFLVSTNGLALKLRSLLSERRDAAADSRPSEKTAGSRHAAGGPAAGSAMGPHHAAGNRPAGEDTAGTASPPPRHPPRIARFGEDFPYFPTDMITVTQPHKTIGRLAMEKLMDLIAGREIPANRRIEILEMDVTE